MTRLKTWDAAEHLETEADMIAFLEAALEEDEPQLVAAVLEDIARARGTMPGDVPV
jgi:probable addiction module antidote protein